MDPRSLLQKTADLLPSIQLQPHQERLRQEAAAAPVRKLLMHSLGSGKSISALGMAEAQGKPYAAIVPAALRPNFQKEIDKATDGTTPSEVISQTAVGMGKKPSFEPHTLIVDEQQRLRNPQSLMSKKVQQLANRAQQLILLSGTPVVNDPSDLAVPTSLLTRQQISPDEFRNRYVQEKTVQPSFLQRLRGVKPGREEDIAHANELKALLKGHVDYYAQPKTDANVAHEDHHVEMGPEQTTLYKGMFEKLPWHVRWAMKNDFPLSPSDLQKTLSFMTGPRQVGLSTLPFLKDKDPLKAFGHSTKLQKAHAELTQHLSDPRKKALVFANFIDAGLTPYAAKLAQQGIPHAVFHGGLNDKQRKQLVDDYNADRIRVALIGPSGTEGLSFRGTQLVQLLDPHWNQTRTNQAQGRGLRFDSHTGLPEDLKDVKIQRFWSRVPAKLLDRLVSAVGFDRQPNQYAADDYMRMLAARKEKLNQKFTDLLREVGTRKE
jgi:superfamily II DNA or RNA helicase